MFKYWNQILNLQLILFQFVKAVHSGDFQASLTVSTVLTPWMFCLNHYSYAKWLPIHIRTMLNLKKDIRGRKVYSEEYQPKVFKIRAGPQSRTTKWKNGVSGAIGLTENDSSLQRQIVAGPKKPLTSLINLNIILVSINSKMMSKSIMI